MVIWEEFMMRKVVISLVVLLAQMGVMWGNDDLKDPSTSAYVVIDAGGNVSRYVADEGDYFLVLVQDTARVEKEGSRLDIFSAKNGQGIIIINDQKARRVNVRQLPTTQSAVVSTISNLEGELPEVLPCNGLVRGTHDHYRWFKTEINGHAGYIREDLMLWDAINTY